MIPFTMLIIITAQKPAQKLLIIRPGIKLAARYSMAMLIIIVNRPSVKMITGNVSSLTSGLTRLLIIPRTAPANNRSCQAPLKTNPGTSLSATKMATELANIWIITLAMKLMEI